MLASTGKKGGDLLKLARAIRGLSQEEVAAAYGVNIKTYRSWENCDTPVAYDDLMVLLDEVFGMDFDNVRGMANAA